ncbi:MAG: hypothetical protein NTU58_02675 [Candidatus Nealsonbacteria bacterium]|nr:hypothetical protein [Candidatus Nealsonbacteria bacterium]
MKKERFIEIMKEEGNYTDEEIETIWSGAPPDIDEEKLRQIAKKFAKTELQDIRLKKEINRQIKKFQLEKLEKI